MPLKKISILLNNLKATAKLAKICQTLFPSPVVFCLFGSLGVGKTQFVKFFAQHLGITQPVISPSFIKMSLYHTPSQKTLVHLDGYHLDAHADLGFFQEYLDSNYVFIEWPQLFIPYLDGFKVIKLIWTSSPDWLTRKVQLEAESQIVDKIKWWCQKEALTIL